MSTTLKVKSPMCWALAAEVIKNIEPEPRCCLKLEPLDVSYIKDHAQLVGRKSNSEIEICGHRGSVYEEPENSIEGFMKSFEIGCHAVELDVFKLQCGTLVVFHGDGDDTQAGLLHDYCGVNRKIEDLTLQEVRELSLNPKCKEFVCPTDRVVSNAKIPTLAEVLSVLKEQTGLKIKVELKGSDTAEGALTAVEEHDMVDRVTFSSFKHDYIHKIRQLRPDRLKYKTGALFSDHVPENFVDIAVAAGASEIHLKYNTCTNERVEEIHRKGLYSMAWFRGIRGMKMDMDCHGLEEGEFLYNVVMSTGVKAMCVNKPGLLIRMLADKTFE